MIPAWPEFTVRPQIGGQAEATGQVAFPIIARPLYRGLKLWDTLPTDLQKEKDYYIFKAETMKLEL